MLSRLNQTFVSESCVPYTQENKRAICLVTLTAPSTPGQSVETLLLNSARPPAASALYWTPEACPVLCCPHSRPRFPLVPPSSWVPGPGWAHPSRSWALTPAAEALALPLLWARLDPSETGLLVASPPAGLPPPFRGPPPSLRASSWDSPAPGPFTPLPLASLQRPPIFSEDLQSLGRDSQPLISGATSEPWIPRYRTTIHLLLSCLLNPNHRDAGWAAVLSPGLGTNLAQSPSPSLWAGHYRLVPMNVSVLHTWVSVPGAESDSTLKPRCSGASSSCVSSGWKLLA